MPHHDPNELTERHKQIARLIAEGVSSKEIARRLVISVKTVDKHRHEIRRRGGFRNSADIARAFHRCPNCGHALADDPA